MPHPIRRAAARRPSGAASAAAATYEVTLAEGYEPGPVRRLAGKDLARLKVEIGQAPGSVVVRYRKVAK